MPPQDWESNDERADRAWNEMLWRLAFKQLAVNIASTAVCPCCEGRGRVGIIIGTKDDEERA